MNIKHIAIALVAIISLTACRHNDASAPLTPALETTTEDEPETQPELVPVFKTVQPAAAPVAKPAPTAAPKQAAAHAGTVELKKGDKIYVETEGAQGRVWGYVTMQGDRGTGTIHDWDENTWAVSVTRHGDELFATDQNSRLYVFKLKK